jgi:hypothetical protein
VVGEATRRSSKEKQRGEAGEESDLNVSKSEVNKHVEMTMKMFTFTFTFAGTRNIYTFACRTF